MTNAKFERCVMSRGVGAIAAAALTALMGAGAAHAQGFSIGPRVWFQFDNFLQLSSNTRTADEALGDALSLNFNNVATEVPQARFDLVGAAVSIPTGLKNTQLVVSVLHGDTELENQIVSGATELNPQFGFIESVVSQASAVRIDDITRTDVDVTARRIFSTGDRLVISALASARYEHSDFESRAIDVSTRNTVLFDGAGDSAGLFEVILTDLDIEATREYYTLRGGAGVFAPVNDAHGFYIDAQAAIGYLDVSALETSGTITVFQPVISVEPVASLTSEATISGEDSIVAGPDITVGYRWNFNDRIGFDARYRTAVLYDIDGDTRGTANDPRVTHGLNLGLSFNF